MGIYTFTSTDQRLLHSVLRGRALQSVDIVETGSWQQVALPALPGGTAVVVVDLAVGAPAIRVAITTVVLTAEPLQGYLVNPGSSLPLGIANGDIINVRTA